MKKTLHYVDRILSTKQTIEALILRELKSNIYKEGTPYIKFLLFPTVIEYLGACLDSHPFKEEGHSEERFNKAIIRLFPERYKRFAKSDSSFYLYEGFRCSMVHRLIPETFVFTTRDEAKNEGNTHLKFESFREEKICLVLEDFYDDIEKAAKKLIKMYDSGKAPKNKGEEAQLRITSKPSR